MLSNAVITLNNGIINDLRSETSNMKKPFILKGNDVEVTGAPEIISILPLGHVISSKGEFDVDSNSFKEMKRQIAQRGVDLVIDYEHQTLKGVQAPAAGWVSELILSDNSIQARVEWTPTASQYLENKEYRYLSPVITVSSDGKAMGLHSLALTNTPAIEGMIPIVNSLNFNESEGGQNTMNFIQRIAQLLGLGENATEDEVMEALGKVLEAVKKPADTNVPDEKIVANKAVCELLDLKAGAPAAEVAAKIMELKGGVIGGINILTELKNLQQQNAAREATDAVTLALKAGKITPAQKEWANSYAVADPQGFASFVDKAPQVVPLGEINLGDTKALKDDKLDEATLLACKQLGLSPDDVKKYGCM